MDIYLAIACHFIGDFPFQNQWFIAEKGKSWEVNFYHAFTYAAVFLLFGCAPLQALVLGLTHFIIDPLKARWNLIPYIWIDQLLHFLVIVILFAIL